MNTVPIIKAIRNDRTQKQYAEFLKVSLRTVQNWESRGTSQTTLMLLAKIQDQEQQIKELEEKLADNNKTFMLPK